MLETRAQLKKNVPGAIFQRPRRFSLKFDFDFGHLLNPLPIETLLGYEQMTRTSFGSSPSIHSSSWLNFLIRSMPPSYSLMNFLIWSSSILDCRRLGEKMQMRCSGWVIA